MSKLWSKAAEGVCGCRAEQYSSFYIWQHRRTTVLLITVLLSSVTSLVPCDLSQPTQHAVHYPSPKNTASESERLWPERWTLTQRRYVQICSSLKYFVFTSSVAQKLVSATPDIFCCSVKQQQLLFILISTINHVYTQQLNQKWVSVSWWLSAQLSHCSAFQCKHVSKSN